MRTARLDSVKDFYSTTFRYVQEPNPAFRTAGRERTLRQDGQLKHGGDLIPACADVIDLIRDLPVTADKLLLAT